MMHGATAAGLVARRQRGALSLTALMLLSMMATMIPAPLASAASTDLAISAPVAPLEGANYSRYDSIAPMVEITNEDSSQMAGARSVRWYICPGDQVAGGCGNQDRSTGISSIAAMAPGEVRILTFPVRFFPDDSVTGIHTAEFKFVESDSDPSDDSYRFNFWIAEEMFDVEVNNQLEMVPENHTYATDDDGGYIYNANTSYPMYIRGTSTSCAGCTFEVELGWRLLNSTGDVFAQDSHLISDFLGGQQNFNHTLPDLISPDEGEFTLQMGVFNSTAETASSIQSKDLNIHNDLVEFSVVFDNSMDLMVDRMYPAYQFDSANYFYGNDSVAVEVANSGNITSDETTLILEMYLADGSTTSELPWECEVPQLFPRESYRCLFDLKVLGDFQLNATLPVQISGTDDSNLNNNWIHETIKVIAGILSPTITFNKISGIYDTGETIEMVAQVGATAAQPLNFTWWLAGIIPKGEGRVLNLSADDLGMGTHALQLRVVDALGNFASAEREVTVFNRTSLLHEPVVRGEALTTADAELQFSSELPRLNIDYNLPRNISPLMILEFDVISTDPEKPESGMDSMELNLNLSSLIPESVDPESLSMVWLDSTDSGTWNVLQHPDEFKSINRTNATLNLIQGGVFLLTGVLPEINVSAENISVEQLPGGYLALHMNPEGDLDNVYFNGWMVMRRVNDRGVPMRHPTDATDEQRQEYENFYLVTYLSPHQTIWNDPVPLATEDCASYAIVPIDRQGIANWDKGNSSGWSGNGTPDMSCGDSIPPFTGVTGLKATSHYINETSCFEKYNDWDLCYEIHVSWNWPSTSENLSFNLYRLEIKPTETLNFTFLQPIETGLSGEAGQTAWWNETSENGIRPNHTFYYVLAPIDSVGNINLEPGSVPSSTVKIKVNNEFWNHNQHVIPEPPPPEEPPYGVEYLGELKKWIDEPRFQTIGLATLVIFVLNLIALPLLLQKRKVIKAKIAKAGPASPDDEMEDDLAAFFT